MTLYAGIDLHSTNNVVVVIDDEDKVRYRKRLRNELPTVVHALQPFEGELSGVVVESTYNWYWLVDGLMEAGYTLHLANTTAIQQYSGKKYADDNSDARWLAHLLRLGILPEAHIYPKAERPVRDLLRKRRQLVHLHTANMLSVQNLIARHSGVTVSGTGIRKQTPDDIARMGFPEDVALAIGSSLAVMTCLQEQIAAVEKTALKRTRLREEYRGLLTVSGIGKILAMTIMLEAGDIGRFKKVGDFCSYARCVPSVRISNEKRKGKGNTKNGNKYLAWAFIEAANFGIRYDEKIKKYYQKKAAKTNRIVALKAIAHKLARASYHILRDQETFDVDKAFA